MSSRDVSNSLETLYGASLEQGPLEQAARELGWSIEAVRVQLSHWQAHPYTYSLPESVTSTPAEEQASAGRSADTTSARRSLAKLSYERWLSQPRPLFVYGTLKRGEYHHDLLEDRQSIQATLPGYRLYHLPFGYPTIAPTRDPNTLVLGELIDPQPKRGGEAQNTQADLLRSVDRLEGFDRDHPRSSFYERTLVRVTPMEDKGTPGAVVHAWAYQAGEAVFDYLTPERLIPTGFWAGRNANPERFRV